MIGFIVGLVVGLVIGAFAMALWFLDQFTKGMEK